MEEETDGGVFKCLVYNGAVSLTLIDGGTFCADGIKTHALTGVAAEAFASALLCVTFIGACLKEETGEVSCTLKTDGAIKNVTVSCSSALCVRGYTDLEEKGGEKGAFGQSGYLLTVRNDGYSRPFSGACELVYGGGTTDSGQAENGRRESVAAEFFARNFTEYYRQSEQLPTAFFLRADAEKNEFLCAALQALPGGDGAWEGAAEQTPGALLRLYAEKKTAEGCFTAAERAAEEIFGETACKEKRRAAYRCKCSRGYLKGVLATLGKEELNSVLNERGEITAHCHYCNKDYVFTREDLKDLL
ncbi:MAG: Hsp33 family molecular chaperone HslO [Candidatus Scatosoma sp.]